MSACSKFVCYAAQRNIIPAITMTPTEECLCRMAELISYLDLTDIEIRLHLNELISAIRDGFMLPAGEEPGEPLDS